MSAPLTWNEEAALLLAQMKANVAEMRRTVTDLRRAARIAAVALPIVVIVAVAVTLWLR